ncbi:MAG: 1-acyl-sn-glycerol-3-phosphate acyltransferase [Actinomycetota bacterium]|nr:1-acyl-sn-glycerol-3-phosphate acyltransferase [Actinomycetota bacterium]
MRAAALLRGRRRPGEMTPRYRLFRRAIILLCRVLFGYTRHGGDRVPPEGPMIVASNHSQYADPVLVGVAVPRRLQWMAKKELFVFPFRKVFELAGAFPVDREGGGRAAVRAALTYLADGWALGIFPEGTHRAVAKEAKSGVVVLALRSGAPVPPVYVGRLPGPLARLRGRRLHIFVGEPIRLDASLRGGAAYRAAADQILRTIYALPERRESV